MTLAAHPARPRKKAKRQKPEPIDPRQLNLFDAPLRPAPASLAAPAPPTAPLQAAAPPKLKRQSRAGRLDEPRVVTLADMPNYSADLLETVDRLLALLPADKVLFTYRNIKASFGVSRATVARRMKDGLVPGIRIANGRVLEEGPIRRLDRTQVRWLLLAVRCCHHYRRE